MILDGVRGKNGSIFGITDKHCWTKAGALGIPDVSGIEEVGLDRVVNTCARSVKYERNYDNAFVTLLESLYAASAAAFITISSTYIYI